MGKRDWTSVRIKSDIIDKINKVLEKNDNLYHCSCPTNFVQVAVVRLLQDVKKKKDKIRWEK